MSMPSWERTRTGGKINLRVIAMGEVAIQPPLVCFDTTFVITCSSTIVEEPSTIVDNSNRRSKCSSHGTVITMKYDRFLQLFYTRKRRNKRRSKLYSQLYDDMRSFVVNHTYVVSLADTKIMSCVCMCVCVAGTFPRV